MNDVNELMRRYDELASKSPDDMTPTDIDQIIVYHRMLRSKPKKEREEAPKIELSGLVSEALGLNKPKPSVGGFRLGGKK